MDSRAPVTAQDLDLLVGAINRLASAQLSHLGAQSIRGLYEVTSKLRERLKTMRAVKRDGVELPENRVYCDWCGKRIRTSHRGKLINPQYVNMLFQSAPMVGVVCSRECRKESLAAYERSVKWLHEQFQAIESAKALMIAARRHLRTLAIQEQAKERWNQQTPETKERLAASNSRRRGFKAEVSSLS